MVVLQSNAGIILDQSENQAEYRLVSLQSKFDLSQDEQKVQFLKEAAELISTFTSSVSREVYGRRAADAAGITPEAMQHEISNAYRRRRKPPR